jgi:hypothetical protein
MKTKIFIAVFALFAALVSCKKAEKGATGPAGANGTNGTNGNANVKMFYFGKDSITTTHTIFSFTISDPKVTSNMMDSSAILFYHQANGFWYSSPGLGWSASYQTRFYTYNSTRSLNFEVYNPDATTYTGSKVVITKFKAVIIPSSDYKGSRKKPVDFNNYYATMQYYGLPLD